jgi:hypothetical protein
MQGKGKKGKDKHKIMTKFSYLSCNSRIVKLIWNFIWIRFDASDEEWICLEN